jgi:hypothetical protein
MSMPVAVSRLDRFLRSDGFRRRRTTWNRKSGDFIDVIDLQTNKTGELVTLNVGVLHSHIHKKFRGGRVPAFVGESACIARSRIGDLVNGKDLWWSLKEKSHLDDIEEKAKKFALPFVLRMHSIKAMEEYLDKANTTFANYPPPIINLALLKFAQGKRREALKLLGELKLRTTSPWKKNIESIVERLEY